jgi:hypothetical protein
LSIKKFMRKDGRGEKPAGTHDQNMTIDLLHQEGISNHAGGTNMRVGKRKIRILALLGLILLLGFSLDERQGWWQPPASAGKAPSIPSVEPDWSHGRIILSNLEGRSVYEQGFFRVIFYTHGEDAVNPTDLNGNSVPDFVEDVALQLAVAHHIYCNLAGFQHPLLSERYKGVSYVDVFLRSRANTEGKSGLSFQSAQRAHAPAPPGARALPMRISTDIVPQRDATPAHEYFHHIQYASTHMLGGWYHEGMATWSGDALNAVSSSLLSWEELDRVLYDPASEKVLFASSYNAVTLLWDPLAALCPDGEEHLPQNDPLLQSRYVDGTPVLKDFTFRGAPVMRRILQEFSSIERETFGDNAYKDWSLENRRDRRNYAYMLRGIRRVVEDYCRAEKNGE